MRETFHDEGNKIYLQYLMELNSEQFQTNRNRNSLPHTNMAKNSFRGARKYS